MTDLTVTIEKTIHAPIEQVFDAWLDPQMLAKFMMPMEEMPEPDVENDARVGGNFSIIMHAGSEKMPHTGQYLEIERPHRLVFSWCSACSVDDSRVTLHLVSTGDYLTDVRLTHVRFLDEKTRTDHEHGWTEILNKLSEVMVGAIPL